MRLDDDTLITPALLQRFAAEAGLEGGNGQYCAFIERSNGDLLIHHPFAPAAVAEQTMFAADVLRKLNRELHHDGAWAIVFTDPKPPEPGVAIYASPHTEFARYALLWVDPDGDVQFAVEWVRGESEMLDFDEVLLAGIEYTMQCCENAWAMWKVAMREVIDPAEGQTFKRAMGQMPSSTRH
jgi:hypothetical protein